MVSGSSSVSVMRPLSVAGRARALRLPIARWISGWLADRDRGQWLDRDRARVARHRHAVKIADKSGREICCENRPNTVDPTIVLSDKLNALCRYYGVKPTDINRGHVLILASRCVPGFQIGRAKRARRKWDDIRLAQLWMSFRSVSRTFSNDESAAANIAMREDFQRIAGNVKPVG